MIQNLEEPLLEKEHGFGYLRGALAKPMKESKEAHPTIFKDYDQSEVRKALSILSMVDKKRGDNLTEEDLDKASRSLVQKYQKSPVLMNAADKEQQKKDEDMAYYDLTRSLKETCDAGTGIKLSEEDAKTRITNDLRHEQAVDFEDIQLASQIFHRSQFQKLDHEYLQELRLEGDQFIYNGHLYYASRDEEENWHLRSMDILESIRVMEDGQSKSANRQGGNIKKDGSNRPKTGSAERQQEDQDNENEQGPQLQPHKQACTLGTTQAHLNFLIIGQYAFFIQELKGERPELAKTKSLRKKATRMQSQRRGTTKKGKESQKPAAEELPKRRFQIQYIDLDSDELSCADLDGGGPFCSSQEDFDYMLFVSQPTSPYYMEAPKMKSLDEAAAVLREQYVQIKKDSQNADHSDYYVLRVEDLDSEGGKDPRKQAPIQVSMDRFSNSQRQLHTTYKQTESVFLYQISGKDYKTLLPGHATHNREDKILMIAAKEKSKVKFKYFDLKDNIQEVSLEPQGIERLSLNLLKTCQGNSFKMLLQKQKAGSGTHCSDLVFRRRQPLFNNVTTISDCLHRYLIVYGRQIAHQENKELQCYVTRLTNYGERYALVRPRDICQFYDQVWGSMPKPKHIEARQAMLTGLSRNAVALIRDLNRSSATTGPTQQHQGGQATATASSEKQTEIKQAMDHHYKQVVYSKSASDLMRCSDELIAFSVADGGTKLERMPVLPSEGGERGAAEEKSLPNLLNVNNLTFCGRMMMQRNIYNHAIRLGNWGPAPIGRRFILSYFQALDKHQPEVRIVDHFRLWDESDHQNWPLNKSYEIKRFYIIMNKNEIQNLHYVIKQMKQLEAKMQEKAQKTKKDITYSLLSKQVQKIADPNIIVGQAEYRMNHYADTNLILVKIEKELMIKIQKLNWKWENKIICETFVLNEDDRFVKPIVVFRQQKNHQGRFLRSEIFLALLDFKNEEKCSFEDIAEDGEADGESQENDQNQCEYFKQFVKVIPIQFNSFDYDLNQHNTIQISPSSEIEMRTLEDGTSKPRVQFKQNYQISIHIFHQNRIKIIEYSIYWVYTIKNRRNQGNQKEQWFDGPADSEDAPQYDIELIGSKELIFTRQLKADKSELRRTRLIPLFNENNDIIGTQLIMDMTDQSKVDQAQHDTLFHFPNSEEQHPHDNENVKYRKKRNDLFEKMGYKLYRSEVGGSYRGVLAYATLSRKISVNYKEPEASNAKKYYQPNFTLEQQSYLIDTQLKTILNTIVFDPVQPTVMDIELEERKIADTQSGEFRLYRQFNDVDFHQRIKAGRCIESLDWYNLITVLCSKPASNSLDTFLSSCFEKDREQQYICEKYRTKAERIAHFAYSSLLERVIATESLDQERELKIRTDFTKYNFDRVETFKENGIYLDRHELLQRDMWFNSVIHYIIQRERRKKPLEAKSKTEAEQKIQEDIDSQGTGRGTIASSRMSKDKKPGASEFSRSAFAKQSSASVSQGTQKAAMKQKLSKSEVVMNLTNSIELILQRVFEESEQEFSSESQECLEQFTLFFITGSRQENMPLTYFEKFLCKENKSKNDGKEILNISKSVQPGSGVYRGIGEKVQEEDILHYINQMGSSNWVLQEIKNTIKSFLPFYDNEIIMDVSQMLICEKIGQREFGQEKEKIVGHLLQKKEDLKEDRNNIQECLFLDLRMVHFNDQIEYFKYGDKERGVSRNRDYYYNKLMKSGDKFDETKYVQFLIKFVGICASKNEQSIQDVKILRDLIDLEYKQAQLQMRKIFYFYVLCFVFPFYYQLFIVDYFIGYPYILACLIYVSFLLVLEVNDMRLSRQKKIGCLEWISWFSWIFMGLFGFYAYRYLTKYASCVAEHMEFCVAEDQDYLDTNKLLVLLIFLFNIYVLFKQAKALSMEFSKIIIQITETLRNIPVFLFYFTFYILIWTVVYKTTGVTYNSKEIGKLEERGMAMSWIIFYQTLLNALGPIEEPVYWETWRCDPVDPPIPEEPNATTCVLQVTAMMGIVWFFWFGNIIIHRVILMNFLISFIGDMHQDIQSRSQILRYKTMAEIIEQSNVLRSIPSCLSCKLCKGNRKTYNGFIIYTHIENETTYQDDEWKGFQKDVYANLDNIKEKIDSLVQVFADEQQQAVHDATEEIKEVYEAHLRELQTRINRSEQTFEESVSEQQARVAEVKESLLKR